MVITKENINKVPKEEQNLLKALLNDLEEINSKLKRKLQIIWIDDDDYDGIDRLSYNGYYQLKFEGSCDTIGTKSTINSLDESMCILYEFIEQYSLFLN